MKKVPKNNSEEVMQVISCIMYLTYHFPNKQTYFSATVNYTPKLGIKLTPIKQYQFCSKLVCLYKLMKVTENNKNTSKLLNPTIFRKLQIHIVL